MKYFSIKPRIHFLQLKKLYEILPQQYPDCPEDVTFEMQRTEVPLPKPCLSDWSSRHSQPLLWGEAGKLGPPGSVGWITQQLQMDTTSPFFPHLDLGYRLDCPNCQDKTACLVKPSAYTLGYHCALAKTFKIFTIQAVRSATFPCHFLSMTD